MVIQLDTIANDWRIGKAQNPLALRDARGRSIDIIDICVSSDTPHLLFGDGGFNRFAHSVRPYYKDSSWKVQERFTVDMFAYPQRSF